jgi:hypothetical protein
MGAEYTGVLVYCLLAKNWNESHARYAQDPKTQR